MFKNVLFWLLMLLFMPSVYAEGLGFEALSPSLVPNYQPDAGKTEGGLWMAMDKFEYDLKTSPKRIRDEVLSQYVHGVVCRLAPDYCNDIRVYITRVPYFNAMMAPNGMMTIWTGLLLRVHNEAQLASVIGHELGHYLRRHSLDRFEDVKFKTGFMTMASIGVSMGLAASNASAGAYDMAGVSMDMGNLFMLASIFAHSRGHEKEADKFGIQLMADAGYDPFEAHKVWKNLIDEDEMAKNKKNKLSFFSTHPNPKDRLTALNDYAIQLAADRREPGRKGRDEYHLVINSHMDDLFKDELNLHQFERSGFLLARFISENTFAGLAHYYKGEIHRKRKQENDLAVAKEHYEKALVYQAAPPETYRSLGLIDLKAKDFSSARENFQQYLALVPDAADREMIEFYMAMGN